MMTLKRYVLLAAVAAAMAAVSATTSVTLLGQSQVQESRYTLQVSDVVMLSYRYSPEFDFTGAVQPDGFIVAPLIGDIRIAGMTVEQAREAVLKAARVRLRDPELSFVLKDFQKPFFTVGGEVEKPGQFELRGRVGVLEAVAVAGGFKRSAKHSQVVLFRRFDNDRASARLIDAKSLAKTPDPEHDLRLAPGDVLFVPQNRISKVERFVPFASLGLLNPYMWR
jgi:polysaccharide export outer membrane protein